MESNSLFSLDQRVDTLIEVCRRLARENRTLRSEQSTLLAEKVELKEKNKLACSRLENIVSKLRVLEEQS